MDGVLAAVRGVVGGATSQRREVLAGVLGAPLAFAVDEVGVARRERRLGEASTLFLLEHGPSGVGAALELDASFAITLVRASLTGTLDAAAPAPRPLDDIELGVALYLVASALRELSNGAPPLRVAGRGDPDDHRRAVADGLTVHLSLSFGTHHGDGWVHLPTALCEALAPALEAHPAEAPDEPSRAGEVVALVALGRATLAGDDLEDLAPGDVIVLDDIDSAEAEASTSPKVDVIIEGRRIGSGTLVAVGGALGVQVDELETDSELAHRDADGARRSQHRGRTRETPDR